MFSNTLMLTRTLPTFFAYSILTHYPSPGIVSICCAIIQVTACIFNSWKMMSVSVIMICDQSLEAVRPLVAQNFCFHTGCVVLDLIPRSEKHQSGKFTLSVVKRKFLLYSVWRNSTQRKLLFFSLSLSLFFSVSFSVVFGTSSSLALSYPFQY